MNQDEKARMLYALLCLVLVGSALLARRMSWSQSAKMIAAWVAIFALVAMGYTLWKAV